MQTPASDSEVFYTIDEVARRLRVSARWLADECRAGRVEHVHIARQRRFTKDQVDALVVSRTVRPSSELELDATRQRVANRLARRRHRAP